MTEDNRIIRITIEASLINFLSLSGVMKALCFILIALLAVAGIIVIVLWFFTCVLGGCEDMSCHQCKVTVKTKKGKMVNIFGLVTKIVVVRLLIYRVLFIRAPVIRCIKCVLLYGLSMMQ